MEMQVNSQLIRSERERRAWSQSHLADVSALGLRTIQRIEAGGSASYESAAAIAAAFSLDVSALLMPGSDRYSASRSAARWSKRAPWVAVGVATVIAGIAWVLNPGIPESARFAKPVEFSDVATVVELEALLAEARVDDQPVMIYVTAEWCVPCRTIEAQALTDSAVFEASEPFLTLRADVTGITDESSALLAALDAFGVPTIAFVDRSGIAVTPFVGTVSPEMLRDRLMDVAAL